MKKTNIIIITLLILFSFSVLGLENLTSSSYNSPESVTFSLITNETSQVSFYISEESDFNILTNSYEFLTNDTTFVYIDSQLVGDTTYYYKFNGTTEGEDTQVFNTEIKALTTDDYKLNNYSVRLILGIFSTIVLSYVVLHLISGILSTNKSITYKILFMGSSILGVLFLSKWIYTILGL